MKETRYFYAPDAASTDELPEDEAQHAVRVLRLTEGDELVLMDGQGSFYKAEVMLTAPHHCKYRIVEHLPQERSWQGRLHLAVAPTKLMERTEWMVEKAVEVGLDKLSFLDCRFSERRVVKLSRIEKIVVSAVKQSRKAWIPEIDEPVTFKDFVLSHSEGLRFIAHCYDEVPRANLFDVLRKAHAECGMWSDTSNVIVMVGPEGDFSIEEVRLALEHGFVSVDLGKSRLRTETAGLAAVMMMQLAQQ